VLEKWAESMSGRRKSNSFLKAFLGVSALAHLNILLVASAFLSLYPDGCNPDAVDLRPFEVSLVSEDEAMLETDPELEKLREELDKEEEEEKKKEKDEKGQVVEMPPPPEERRPDKAKFLSEYDSKVKKQTKSKPVPFKAGSLVADRPLPRPKPEVRQQPPRRPPGRRRRRKSR